MYSDAHKGYLDAYNYGLKMHATPHLSHQRCPQLPQIPATIPSLCLYLTLGCPQVAIRDSRKWCWEDDRNRQYIMPTIVSIMFAIFLIYHAYMIFWRCPQYFPCPRFYHAHSHLCHQVCMSIVMSPSPCHLCTNIFVLPKSSSTDHKMGHLTL